MVNPVVVVEPGPGFARYQGRGVGKGLVAVAAAGDRIGYPPDIVAGAVVHHLLIEGRPGQVTEGVFDRPTALAVYRARPQRLEILKCGKGVLGAGKCEDDSGEQQAGEACLADSAIRGVHRGGSVKKTDNNSLFFKRKIRAGDGFVRVFNGL
jgi:hypothetical protein